MGEETAFPVTEADIEMLKELPAILEAIQQDEEETDIFFAGYHRALEREGCKEPDAHRQTEEMRRLMAECVFAEGG